MAKTKKSQASQKPLQSNSLTDSQKKISISLSSAEKVIHYLLQKTGYKELGLHFVGLRKISQLHAEYFDDPTPTDCISFPYDDPVFLGEIFVCPEIAKSHVDRFGGNLEKEITLYVVHGFLHLLGFDDLNKQEREKMRAEEEKWMRNLAKNNLGITIK